MKRILIATVLVVIAGCKKTPAPSEPDSSSRRNDAPRETPRAVRDSALPPRAAGDGDAGQPQGAAAAVGNPLGFVAREVHGVIVLKSFFQSLKTSVDIVSPIAALFGSDNPIDSLVAEVRTKVGINPFDKADLTRIGIDTSRDIVIPLNERGHGFAFVVPITSPTAVHRFLVDTLRRISEEEAQGRTDVPPVAFTTTKEKGTDITVVAGKLAWAVVGTHVIVVPEGPAVGADTIRKALGLPLDRTYATLPELAAARASLAADSDGILFLGAPFVTQWLQRFQREVGGGENDALTRTLKALQGVAFGFSVRPDRLKVEVVCSFAEEERSRIAATLTRKATMASIGKRVEADVVGFAAASINLHDLLKRLFEWRPSVKVEWGNLVESVRERAKIDLEELLANLNGQGGVAILDVMPPRAGVSSQLLGPLSRFSVVIYAGLTNPAVFKTVAHEIERTVAQIGKMSGGREFPKVTVARRNIDGVTAYTLGRGKEEAMSLAVVNDLFVLTSGKGRMEKAIAAIKGKAKGIADAAANPDSRKRLARDSLVSLYLSGAQTAKLIPKFLDELGLVPAGAKGEVSALVKALQVVEALHLDINAENPGLRGDLTLLLKPLPAKR